MSLQNSAVVSTISCLVIRASAECSQAGPEFYNATSICKMYICNVQCIILETAIEAKMYKLNKLY